MDTTCGCSSQLTRTGAEVSTFLIRLTSWRDWSWSIRPALRQNSFRTLPMRITCMGRVVLMQQLIIRMGHRQPQVATTPMRARPPATQQTTIKPSKPSQPTPQASNRTSSSSRSTSSGPFSSTSENSTSGSGWWSRPSTSATTSRRATSECQAKSTTWIRQTTYLCTWRIMRFRSMGRTMESLRRETFSHSRRELITWGSKTIWRLTSISFWKMKCFP